MDFFKELPYVAGISFFSGFVRWLKQRKQDETSGFFENILESVFAGIIVFYICNHFKKNIEFSLIFVMMAGYFSPEFCDILKKRVVGFFKKFSDRF